MEHMKENTSKNKRHTVACDTDHKPVSNKEVAA